MVLLVFISGIILNAQSQSFNISVQNIVQTATNRFEFDVYLLNTDPSQNFELAGCQLGFLMNSLVYTGGSLSARIDNTGSDLEKYQQFTVKPVVESKLSGFPDETLVRLASTPSITKPGTIISTVAPGTLLTHFILTGSVVFTINSTPNLIFISSDQSSPLYPTKVTVYLNTGLFKYKKPLKVTPGDNALVKGNPVLNPVNLPEVFEVTGTGSYCQGDEGLAVGLNGSEAGVKYTLYKNGVPQEPSVEGTGREIIFGNRLSGKYTVTGANKAGITEMKGSAIITENPTPAAPVPGTITHPTCELPTGSVILNGLPQSGSWTVTVTPGGITKRGEGTNTTITGLPANTYTFTVTDAAGCISQPSANVIIQEPPATPSPPVPGTLTPPTCTLATGSILLTGLPSQGSWTITRYPGAIKTTGSGTSSTISGLQTGTYYFTVTGASGCASSQSGNVIIPGQPPTPSAPVIGQITQPTYIVATGSVLLSGLPSSSEWRLTRTPGGIITPGSGTSITVSGLEPGTYTFTVTNKENCTSPPSANVIINEQPGPLNLIITDPPAICSTTTVDLTSPAITAGSDEKLKYSYWIDKDATIPLNNPKGVSEGTYYIKGTLTIDDNTDYFIIKPVNVTVDQMPVANAGPDQVLIYTFETAMDAQQPEYGKGEWAVKAGSGNFSDSDDPKTTVSNLSFGRNDFLWTVSNGVCPKATDEVIIVVGDLVVPSLITPDMDGKNDYFILRGINSLGRTELVIFDRRGAKVYWHNNYDNTWNGVDHKGNPLSDDTYFYVLKSENGKSMSGFVVIRK